MPVFDGKRLWKNGKPAVSQAGRVKRPSLATLIASDGTITAKIDFRRKEFRHLKGQLVRDRFGRLHRPGEEATGPATWGSTKKSRYVPAAPRFDADGHPIHPNSRKHLIANGVYVRSGKPHGVCHRRWAEKKGKAVFTVRMHAQKIHELEVVAGELGLSRDAFCDRVLTQAVRVILQRRARERADSIGG